MVFHLAQPVPCAGPEVKTMLALMMTLILVSAPTDPPVGMTRAEETRLAREEKARHLEPPKRGFLEKGLHEFKERRLMERFQEGWHGFHPLVGGMRAGAGFAVGASYTRGPVTASSQLSLKGYQKHEVALETSRIGGSKLFANVRGGYQDSTQETFFGVGNDSKMDDRANYRLEQFQVRGEAGMQITPQAKLGGTLGWIDSRVHNATESKYGPLGDAAYVSTLNAFDDQPEYVETGAFLDIDYRDVPGNPRRGARYLARWSSFHDRNLEQFGFSRVDIEVQQYFPFFNDRRVIALRAKTALARAADGQDVPFYMLPALGGGEDLRGFSEFRFRDRNMALITAEYRWEAFSGLDVALFADAGQVANRISDFKLSEMKTAGGLGLRFNTSKQVFCRVDLGFSKEGPRLFLNFGHVF
jgi:outer membrane protein assembly factor BamA